MNQLSKTESVCDSVELAKLAPFDTIHVQTHHSDYRIFLLDPGTGRALVEGGHYFAEPSPALVSGATTLNGSATKLGEIATGFRLEMWVNNRLVSTSPVESICVCHPVSDFATRGHGNFNGSQLSLVNGSRKGELFAGGTLIAPK